jgi:hypothetical protein
MFIVITLPTVVSSLCIVSMLYSSVIVNLSRTARKERRNSGTPIKYGRIILKSLAIATVVGLLVLVCTGCHAAEHDVAHDIAHGGNGGSVKEAESSETFNQAGTESIHTGVPPQMPMPQMPAMNQPQWHPQMDWTPLRPSDIQG